jgi:hypothetical protein
MLYDQMVKPRNEKSGLGREQRPVKKREDVHRLEAPGIAGEPVDERDETSLARKLEVERPIVLGRSKMASSVSRAIVPYQITHIYPMFFLTA